MKILAKTGRDDIAVVYVAELAEGKRIEFVESVQPPLPREKKWVLIVSSLYGCPVKCRFCDAGGFYQGTLSKADLLSQIDFLVSNRFADKKINVEKFKIQFARMGEPAFNSNVLDVLEDLPQIYDAPGLIPSVSTIAPNGAENFFERLLEIKNKYYKGKFQLQFSIHTTDIEQRNWLIPVKKWDFKQIAEYGELFYTKDDRKITLNFALSEESFIDAKILLEYFDPEKFLIKITPVNPTYNAVRSNLASSIISRDAKQITALKNVGYNVILSIGELEENSIGSNCGQYLTNFLEKKELLENSYTYELQKMEVV